MRTEFTFHQALFGYDTGHHLLSASLDLPPDVQHLLAVATDLSGSAPPEGFDAAYTGLPLIATNYYALFCTWLAPEMRRPGCVWSHVVLIELADFAELPDLGALRRVFQRPASNHFDAYQSPVRFRTRDSALPTLSSAMILDTEKLLAALYIAPKQSIVLPVGNSRNTEEVIFALWSQQWPRLRRNFRFSSGSFADRGRIGMAFDLQVSPEANRRAWHREGEYLLLDRLRVRDFILEARAQPWMNTALHDLFAPDEDGFRSFLRAYGADVNEPRSTFARLALAYERIFNGDKKWVETLQSIGEIFPDQSEAILLKESLVTPRTLSEDSERNLATVSFLLTSDVSKPYAGVSADFPRLARALWLADKKETLSLVAQLASQQEHASAVAFAAAVANTVQPTELRLISEERPELLPLFLSNRPSFAFHVDTWQLPTHAQSRIYEVLDGLTLDPKEWGEIVTAMFLARTNVAVRDAVEKAGPHAIEGALQWLDSRDAQQCLPSQLWREALAASAADRIRTTELPTPAILAFCSWFLRPDVARQLLNASRQDVQKLAEQPLEGLPLPLRLHTAFLLVTLGLRSSDVTGGGLLVRGFFVVYDALASGDYSSESWLLLSPELPQLGMWNEWDRCKKLRQAVRKRLSHDTGIMAKAVFEAAVSPEHIAIARKLCRGFAP